MSGAEKSSYKILLNSGAVSKKDLDRIVREAESSDLWFSSLLVRSGLIKESKLLDIYAQSLGAPRINLKNIDVDKSLIAKVPIKIAWYYKFFPVKLSGKKLTIAAFHVLDVNIIDEIRFGLGFEIEMVFATEAEIEDKLKEHYGLGADTVDKILAKSDKKQDAKAQEPKVEVQNIEKLAETASVVQLVNQIILDAFRKRASDIHIEPQQGGVRIRYRIDGTLQEAKVPGDMKRFMVPILSRFKIMANLNIVEKRLPQDGKARVKTADQNLDLRISSIPTAHGEGMVIRILPSKMVLTLEELGFEEENLEAFRELIRRPFGVIFVTGPTGSGKTTTLYAGLNAINSVGTKVITIEDPVEYELPGISQIQVLPDIGLSFARGLRSVLRHDPDVMMVGEVRDLETADIAIRAALTGHLMISTLHTNDAASAVTRLLDIGVEPYLVSSSVIGIVAQRLVKVICQNCKQEDTDLSPQIRETIVRDVAMGADETVRTYHGAGCDECNGSGYQGRMPIHEIMLLNEGVRRSITSGASSDEIKDTAMAMGMKTLRQDGWRKVLKGMTTVEEIMRVTPADERSSGAMATAQASSGAETSAMGQQGQQKPAQQAHWIGHERRRYGRVNVKFCISFRAVDMMESTADVTDNMLGMQGELSNLSAGGLCFTTEHRLKEGDMLDFIIDIKDGHDPILCIGKALRIEQVKRSDGSAGKAQYRAGIAFLAINSSDRKRLENYCKRLAKNEAV